MNWPALAVADYVAIVSMLGGALLFIFKMIQRMRTNDLAHLDEKIDSIAASTQRIEDKIDDHVRDHATGLFQ